MDENMSRVNSSFLFAVARQPIAPQREKRVTDNEPVTRKMQLKLD
jgi:hypothetical protein